MRRYWLPSLSVVLCVIFANLGLWQLKRLDWKNDLIARIQRNTVMQALPLQRSSTLDSLKADSDEYRRVSLSGIPDCARATPVWAATQLGSGYWWMVPVRLQDGSSIWVNRGYVTPDAVAAWRAGRKPECSQISIEGLLRKSQTGGGFLRPNDPGAGRWYSRDIQQMSESTQISNVSTAWFVDEWASSGQGLDTRRADGKRSDGKDVGETLWSAGMPDGASIDRAVPGLTPLQFPNKHLGYALTWFALSAACVLGGILALRAKV